MRYKFFTHTESCPVGQWTEARRREHLADSIRSGRGPITKISVENDREWRNKSGFWVNDGAHDVIWEDNFDVSSHLPELLCRNWHPGVIDNPNTGLPRFLRAGPSTSLDKSDNYAFVA
jgi:hypothetical protein